MMIVFLEDLLVPVDTAEVKQPGWNYNHQNTVLTIVFLEVVVGVVEMGNILEPNAMPVPVAMAEARLTGLNYIHKNMAERTVFL